MEAGKTMGVHAKLEAQSQSHSSWNHWVVEQGLWNVVCSGTLLEKGFFTVGAKLFHVCVPEHTFRDAEHGIVPRSR
jgi:hypothetical protein